MNYYVVCKKGFKIANKYDRVLLAKKEPGKPFIFDVTHFTDLYGTITIVGYLYCCDLITIKDDYDREHDFFELLDEAGACRDLPCDEGSVCKMTGLRYTASPKVD